MYVEIRKGIYGLPQAGMLAHKKLSKHLLDADFYASEHTPGLWQHRTRPIQFSLVVDDFGVKYVGKQNAQFLIDTLHNAKYQLSINWEATRFCGVTLRWDYKNHNCFLSMPGYINKVLRRFHHTPSEPTHSPAKWTPPVWCKSTIPTSCR